MRRAALLFALALVLGACGEEGTDVSSDTTSSTTDIAESLPRETTTTIAPTTTTTIPPTTVPTTAAPTTTTRPPTTLPPTTAASPTTAAPREQSPSGGCHPSYQGACLPPDAEDVDCAGGSGNGPVYTGRVTVVGPDVYDLDRDGDGVGCQNS